MKSVKLFLVMTMVLFIQMAQGAKMEIKKYTLKNASGMEVDCINYGGIITRVLVADKNGKMGDVVLGFDDPNDYQKHTEHPYFGAIVGRYGNRIAKGRFTLNGKEYKLAVNNGPNALHGGVKGFDKVFWNVEEMKKENALKFTYTSKDGEEGFPGNLNVSVTYKLTDANEIKIDYKATTDKATPVNMTNHSYFNLSADKDQSILDHVIMINADGYTAVDQDLTPTGETTKLAGTEMDFIKPKRIGKDIAKVKEGGGYDHNFVLRDASNTLKQAATLHDPKSGRFLEVLTTEPGIQFYSGNFLDGKLKGKNGDAYKKNDGLCLETQHFPDSPNHPIFPSTILVPGKELVSTTVYKFSVR